MTGQVCQGVCISLPTQPMDLSAGGCAVQLASGRQVPGPWTPDTAEGWGFLHPGHRPAQTQGLPWRGAGGKKPSLKEEKEDLACFLTRGPWPPEPVAGAQVGRLSMPTACSRAGTPTLGPGLGGGTPEGWPPQTPAAVSKSPPWASPPVCSPPTPHSPAPRSPPNMPEPLEPDPSFLEQESNQVPAPLPLESVTSALDRRESRSVCTAWGWK